MRKTLLEYRNLIAVHYTGTLLDGTMFNSSCDRGDLFTFTLGQGYENRIEGKPYTSAVMPERTFRVEAMIWSSVIQKYAFFVMQTYLTDVWGLSFTHAAGILNIWEGVRMILQPISLHFLADFLGDFKMLVISGHGLDFYVNTTSPGQFEWHLSLSTIQV